MLGWCIVTLASARLKASVWFPPLRRMYQRGGTCRGATAQVVGTVSLQTKNPILPPNEAFEAGGDASTNNECEGMDVDTAVTAEEVGGEEDVAETQDDSLSLPGMDSP